MTQTERKNSYSEKPNSSDLISRQMAIDAVKKRADKARDMVGSDHPFWEGLIVALDTVEQLPSVQPDIDITAKIDKAYDDGYETGYLQGRHDWGDLDE